ncbi:hypothetical protein [Paeniglutamicibacter kerguelensis]|uniref:DUF202 domain-containing protein n=1 Tax=Paeniglutamicibacter kerguelensis TaxID=254788 RepID=A0ABS4X8K3_9MICC|nr:hypothetical protein [Paeniglutamicibacter kerguelensis]MBP2384797.1 hypothetical protein [Paeniglutamicibacter kerguelensis]
MAVKPLSPGADPARPLFAWVRATILIMAVAYAASFAPLPWRLVGLPFAAAGLVIGFITCLKALRNPGAGFLRLAAPIATLACGLVAVTLGAQALFYKPSIEYQQCMADALTLSSQQQCTTNLQNELVPD